MGSEGGPKQYRTLAGKSVLQRTVEAFASHPDIHAIQVVIHIEDGAVYRENIDESCLELLPPVSGGATRQESCKAGLDALGLDYDKVLIHDAARPFVTQEVISCVLDGIETGICSLPACAIADTLKRADADNNRVETVSREGIYTAQTPQGFILSEIAAAHEKAAEDPEVVFTDDAAVAEHAGMRIKIVQGDRSNFKITTQQDLELAKKQMNTNSQHADIRTGSGYDVHTLGPGDKIILCGVEIPHNQALQGHSDADVGLHALTDALLGTIGEGDIGSHFPPTDAQWKGASSDRFLKHAAELVKGEGGAITNLDVTLVCETPKITPHRDAMRNRIAEIVDIEVARVSVKATTNEKMGFVGRGEGIAALATATVSFGGLSIV